MWTLRFPRLLATAVSLATAVTSGSTAGAQSILLRTGTAGGRIQVAPGAKVGIPVVIDMSAAAGSNLASLTTGMDFGTARLTLDSVRSGAFGALTVNTTNASAGSIILGIFNAQGTTATASIATAWFTTSATTGGTTIAFSPTVAGSDLGASILAQLRVRNLDVCVAPSGKWGDVTGDSAVNIIDAQQIARATVGLGVLDAALVTTQGDVNADGTVNIIDAQQIARFAVGLSAAALTNTARFIPPVIASVSLTGPSVGNLAVGASAQFGAALKDAAGVPQNGCVATTWTTTNAASAPVDSTGRVYGVANGTATITATAGGQTASTTITVSVPAGAPAAMTITSGNNQYIVQGRNGGLAVEVKVTDAAGIPVPGVAVVFAPAASGGSVRAAATSQIFASLSATTDQNGLARAAWVGGSLTSDPQVFSTTRTLVASATGLAPVTFTSTVVSGEVTIGACARTSGSAAYCWGDMTARIIHPTLNDSTTGAYPELVAGAQLASFSSLIYGYSTCGLTAAGAAYCWGWNSAGELGNGTRTASTTWVPVSGNLVFTSVSSGWHQACGVTTANVAYCWGLNSYGQLGNGQVGTSEIAPVQVSGGLSWSSIATGGTSTCGVTTAGALYCWGSGFVNDVTGVLLFPTPVRIGAGSSYTQVAVGTSSACALTTTGRIECWGANTQGVFGDGTSGTSPRIDPAPVSGTTVFNRVTAAGNYACGGTSTGALYCWGGNSQATLGTGDLLPRSVPTQIAADATGPITLTLFSGCYVAATGQPWCWGSFGSGEGVGPFSTVRRRLSPVPVRWVEGTAGQPRSVVATTPLVSSDVAGAAATSLPSVRVRDYANTPVVETAVTFAVASGSATLSGATAFTNANGVATLGGFTTAASSVSSALVLNASVASAGSVSFTINLTVAPATVSIISGDSVWTGGINSSWLVPQVLRVTDAASSPIPNVSVVFTPDVSSGTLSGGVASYATITDADGRVTVPGGTWQPNFTEGAVSKLNAVVGGYATPVTFSAYRGQSNSAATSCELTAAGAAYCTGSNLRGTVGDGTTTTRNSAVAVSGGQVFSALAEGIALHKCGLVSGAAFCWGYNGAGQLGDGTTTDRSAPVAVTGGLSFTSLVTQGNTTCGLTSANLVYCWGWSGTNGWGGGDAVRGRIRLTPTLVNTGASTFTRISLLDDGLCGLTAAGAISCRGNGSRGVNGDGTFAQRTTFTQWTGGPWSDLSAGSVTACALDAGSLAWCVGSESQGALGDGVASGFTQATPVQTLGGLTFQSIHTGFLGGCARRSTGDVYCWGANSGGQAGQGSTNIVLQPTKVPGFTFTSLRQTGFQNACGKVSNGLLYCWGQNFSGQVGDGTFLSPRPSPVAVVNWPEGPAAGVAVSMGAVTTVTPAASGGAPVTPTPAVAVRDRLGAGVAGVVVTFTAASGNGTVTGGSVTTDANGVATVGSWTLPLTLGSAQLIASATGFPTVAFNATVLRSAVGFVIAGGNNQFSLDFESSVQSLSVMVRDSSNQPITGLPVTWSVTTGNGTISGGTSTVTTTNSSGIASLFGWAPPTAINTVYTLAASVAGQPPVIFTAQRLPWNFNGSDNPTAATCRLTSVGAAYCWGGNAQGADGDGSTTTRTAPVAVAGGLTFASLARGPFNFHMCGLTSSGQAYCWGSNVAGQLGDSTRTNRTSPVQVHGGLTFTSLYTGVYETCGLVSSGAMYCWGWGSWSHRGDGEINTLRTVPTLVNTAGHTFASLALGMRSICAVDGAQQAFCWGQNFGGHLGTGDTKPQPTAVATSTPLRFTQLTGSSDHTCGLTTGSTVACWGNNFNGAVGNGTTTNQLTPLIVSGIASATAVWSGESHNCALAATTVSCWGANFSGQVGDGTNTSPRTSPVVTAAGITPTGLVSFSRSLSCATTSAQLYCWGGQQGGVGDGTGFGRNVPTAVQWPEASATAPATITSSFPLVITGGAGVSQNITVQVKRALGTPVAGVPVSFVVTSGGGSVSVATVNTDASGIAATAWTLAGSTGTVGTMEARVSDVPSLKFTATIASVSGTIMITGGNNQYLPDYIGSATGLQVKVVDGSGAPIPNTTVTFAATSGSGTVGTAVVNTAFDGTATNYSWNPPNVAGVDYTLQASVPGLSPLTFTARRLAYYNNPGSNLVASACRLITSGAAYCWGGNVQGQVGDASNVNRSAPVAVAGGLAFTSLAQGSQGSHNCALVSGGAAYCWGANEAGQLGNGIQTSSNVPVAVAGGLAFTSLSTGPLSTCGISTASALYCWGWGGVSFRGDSTRFTIRTSPTLVNTGGRTFVGVSVGRTAICALDAAGQAFCWGDNWAGQLGAGTNLTALLPVATSTALRFSNVALGVDHACGRTTASTIACWGYNSNGAVGNGSSTNQLSPQVLAGVAGALEVRSGESHSCARTGSSVYCWGANYTGQVGDGSTTTKTSPQLVFTGLPTSLPSFAKSLSCVATASQHYCWGSTEAGVGDGTGNFRQVPTAILWPEAVAGPLATITVTPSPATVLTNGTLQFTAVGRDASGIVVAISPVWSVVNAGGTISSVGLFTAGNVAATFANTVRATSGTLSGAATVTVTAPSPFVNLGTAAPNGIMATTAVTCVSGGTISADISISPGNTLTGFPPCVVAGVSHLGDGVATQAQIDLLAAYNTLAGLSCPTANAISADLGGTTKAPGVYCSAFGITITGNLTLDGGGDPNANFVFQAGTNLTTAGDIVLINGAQARNVWFQVGTSATLGTMSHIQGTIISLSTITLSDNATLLGRALARNGAVSLGTNNVITLP